MKNTTYDKMTKTYRVKNADRTFDSYTPQQYIDKFGTLPEPVEDVTDVVDEPEVPATNEPEVPATDEPEVPATNEPEVPATNEPGMLGKMKDAIISNKE